MKITVLAGGLSPERDVSLSSASLIANSLIKSGHVVALADVYEGLKEGMKPSDMFTSTPDFSYSIPSSAPDLDEIRRRNGNRRELIGPGVIELCREADVTFLGLHGDMGENGQLQAVLDVYGIKYTGSGHFGCALAMDKDAAKRIVSREGVLTADWIFEDASAPGLEERILEQLGLPCVVKPCACGSSVGVSIVRSSSELSAALGCAAGYGMKILVEKLIVGREFSVAVLTGMALPPIEIIPRDGFYDYKNKYQAGCTTEIVPAEISPELTERIQQLTLTAHNALRLGTYSRSDFILEKDTGDFYYLETNTLPGMTPTSLVPQEAAAAGIGYDELCNLIVSEALK